jgi:Family of unknown function (DUF6313)
MNGLEVGWGNAYAVTVAIKPPGEVHYLWAWPLSIAGWLAMPGLTGAVAGYVVSSSIGGRRSIKIEKRFAPAPPDRVRRRTVLIPLLKDLISKRNRFEISEAFVPSFVIVLHTGSWRRGQDHWESYVSATLDTDLIDRQETGDQAMKHAVRLAAAALKAMAVCPVCASGRSSGERA